MRGAWLLVPSILLLAFLPVAAAHGDRSIEDGTVVLAPEETVSWTREVHWHRLMGTVEATGPVTVSAQGPDGIIRAAGPGTDLQVDHLIACCRTAIWSPHTITITNEAEGPVEVAYDLVLLHDNLAVTAHDAEPGAWWQTLAIVGLMIAIPAWRARQPQPDQPARPWLRRSRAFHAAAWGTAVALALVGMVRFASWPLTGSLGATAWTPLDLGGFFNTHSFVMLALMGLWGTGLAFWAGARRRAGSPAAYRWDGLLFAAGSIVIGTLMVVEFGVWPIPTVIAVLPAAGIVLDLLGRARGRLAGR